MKKLFYVVCFVILSACGPAENGTEDGSPLVSRVTSTIYDSNDMLISRRVSDYFYNSDNLVTRIDIKSDNFQSPGRSSEYTIHINLKDNESDYETYSYTLKRENTNSIERIDYNYEGDLITSTTSTFDNNEQEDQFYEYNTRDLVVESTRNNVTYTFEYDSQDQLIKRVFNIRFPDGTINSSRITRYSYSDIKNPFYNSVSSSSKRIRNTPQFIRYRDDEKLVDIEVNEFNLPMNITFLKSDNSRRETNYQY
ncbi:hypothetical protein [Tenacibaculum jejuense]|uniref:Lipoprotein n=1 Tax=Tenacibaculum jejuense TaxID=584609 RepID=A0A238U7R9_9FLAO|nr:hypothetical protein [Tenacibaculum jejuense]SNR15095.1 protein of unknown function [Tenacibaculum jejuense]